MATKIRLSAEEKRLVSSEQFILTKNLIIQKAMNLFGELKLDQDLLLQGIDLPPGTASAKISKGENYKGLPWIMLDHPRYFTKQEVVAIRSFFWWGNFFSITLHLAGEPKEKAIPRLLEQYRSLRKSGVHICVNEDAWQHDMSKKNYRPLKKISEKEYRKIIQTKGFVKFSVCFSLKKWERARKKMDQCYGRFAELLNAQL